MKTSIFFLSLSLFFTSVIPVCPQSKSDSTTEQNGPKALLIQAVMCEGVQNYAPVNPSIVFSIDSGSGKISCFTAFDPVPENMFIYHTWYHQDRMVTQKKLSLKSPKWDTFSSIELREMDKGPWFVEISDLQGNIFKTLRFSITD